MEELLGDISSQADDRSCFIESDVCMRGADRHWGRAVLRPVRCSNTPQTPNSAERMAATEADQILAGALVDSDDGEVSWLRSGDSGRSQRQPWLVSESLPLAVLP